MPIYVGSTKISQIFKDGVELSSLKFGNLDIPLDGLLVTTTTTTTPAPSTPNEPTNVNVEVVEVTTTTTTTTTTPSPFPNEPTNVNVEVVEVTTTTTTTTTAVPGDPLWNSVLLLTPFDADTTDVKSAITPTVTGTAMTINNEGKFSGSATNTATNRSTYSTGSFGAGDWTVECWIRRDNFLNLNERLIDLGSVEIEAAGNSGLRFYYATSDSNFDSGTVALTQGQWYHVAIVRDSGTLRSYVDGVQQGSLSATVSPSTVQLGNNVSFDDLRVTTACRYPDGTTFTPPTSAHLTS